MNIPRTVKISLFKHVAFKKDCWLWTGALKENGYGCMGTNQKSGMYPHRVSFELFNGPIPRGLCVLHTCDNRRCINPDHLWIGTHADNARDMIRKNRARHGEKHPGAKLTEKDVIFIKNLMSDNAPRDHEIARLFNLKKATISAIRRNKLWINVAWPIPYKELIRKYKSKWGATVFRSEE